MKLRRAKRIAKARALKNRKSKRSFPFMPSPGVKLKNEKARVVALRTLDDQSKIQRIKAVSGYGRAARRALWKKVAITDQITWKEYKELELLLLESNRGLKRFQGGAR